MDEPFSALDPPQSGIVKIYFEMLSDKTVIMVTHDVMEAVRLSDTVYIMKDKNLKAVELKTLLMLIKGSFECL